MEEAQRVKQLGEILKDTAVEVNDRRTSGCVAKGRVVRVVTSSAGNPIIILDTGFDIVVRR